MLFLQATKIVAFLPLPKISLKLDFPTAKNYSNVLGV
jgi:hypothetical protein